MKKHAKDEYDQANAHKLVNKQVVWCGSGVGLNSLSKRAITMALFDCLLLQLRTSQSLPGIHRLQKPSTTSMDLSGDSIRRRVEPALTEHEVPRKQRIRTVLPTAIEYCCTDLHAIVCFTEVGP